MTTNEMIGAVTRWQATPAVHHLTCGTDRRHRPLVAVAEGGKAILVCLDCDFRQFWIPEIVLRAKL